MDTLVRDGNWGRALEVFDAMQAQGVRPNAVAFSAALSACEAGGRWKRAVEIWEKVQEGGVTRDNQSLVMQARGIFYAVPPGLLESLPESLVSAARVAVGSGRAARQWLEKSGGAAGRG